MEQTISELFVGGGIFVIVVLIGVPIFAIIANYIESRETHKIPKNPRQEANFHILAILLNYVEKNPDQRFGQVLRNTGVVVDVGVKDSSQHDWDSPDFYWVRGIHEEPMATLARMEATKRGIYKDTEIIKGTNKL